MRWIKIAALGILRVDQVCSGDSRASFLDATNIRLVYLVRSKLWQNEICKRKKQLQMAHSHLMFKSMLNENLGGIPRWQPMLNG
jgi:hypothetical protein